MIDRSTVDRIYAAADIVDIVNDFVTLKKKGVNYQACCPFHNEKTPSFVVSPSKGVFKCFGCGKGGNAVSFVMEHEGISYTEALKYVARKYGIEVKEREETPEDKRKNDDRESMLVLSSYARDYFMKSLNETDEGRNIGFAYFRERGFSDAIIEKFQLGYCPSGGGDFAAAALKDGYQEDYLVRTGLSIKRDDGTLYDRFAGRVMFPIHGISGRVTAFGGRTLRTDKKVAKYLNSPESEIYHKSDVLYGLYFAKKAISQENSCILVEGYTDVISMHQNGVENVVASSGTSLTQEQVKLIGRFTKNITVIFDGDAAGIKASLRGIDMILKEGLNVRVVLLPESEDPDSFARSRSASELKTYILENEQDFISFKARLLISDAKNDPIKRAAMITDIVDSIAVIPDAIARNVYVRECASITGTGESLLTEEVRKRRMDKEFTREEKEFFRKRELESRIPSESVPGGAPNEGSGGSGLEVLEYELLCYLLRYGLKTIDFGTYESPHLMRVADAIISDLREDAIEFKSPVYNTILKEYCTIYDDNSEEGAGTFSIGRLADHSDPQVCSVVVDIMMRTDMLKASELWKRSEIIVENEEDKLYDAVPRAITLYKSKIIESMIDDLAQKLSELVEFNDEAGEIMKQINQLNNTRKLICEKYSRIIL